MKHFFHFKVHSVLKFLLFFVVIFAGGFFTRDIAFGHSTIYIPESQTENLDLEDIQVFWEVWDHLKNKHPKASDESLTDKELIHAATKGLVNAYDDPYTNFLTPVESDEFGEDIDGEFGGVGIEVDFVDDKVVIITPLRNSPAKAAGILAGDIIVAVDGENILEASLDSAVSKIRGPIGEPVVLSVAREDELEVLDISITRELITIPVVETHVEGDGVFVLNLYHFNQQAARLTQEALVEFLDSPYNTLLIDLRSNPGGLFDSALQIAEYFLPEGKVIAREDSGEGTEQILYRSSGQYMMDFNGKRIALLVNEGSASASEILAGALHQHQVAEMFGQTTFGKGSVQELVPLSDGSSLKITVARWLTPNGTSLDEGGLTPQVAFSDETLDAYEDSEDPMLDATLWYIEGTQ